MIGSLLIACALSRQAQAPPVIEHIEPAATRVALEAVVHLPELSIHDQKVLEVLARVLPEGTTEYTRRSMLVLTSGEPVSCRLMPDNLALHIELDRSSVNDGLSLLNGLCRRAKVSDEVVSRASDSLDQNRGFWSQALFPGSVDSNPVTTQEVQSLYARLFRPEFVQIAVGGNLEPGSAQAEWDRRTADWVPLDPDPSLREVIAHPVARVSKRSVSVLAIKGDVRQADDPALPITLLALVALGSGKDSSLFRIPREIHGWSYRQESILWPVQKGWQPQLVVAMAGDVDIAARSEQLRKELAADIAKWGEPERLRAIGMSEGILMHGVPFSPLYLRPDGPVPDGLAGRTFLAAYWYQKTGSLWNPSALLKSIRSVQLEDLKEEATKIITESKS